MLRAQLERVRERIQQACHRSGRDPSSVTLVCVTKGISPETIQQAIALGVTDIGENRVQEARAKQVVLGSRFKVQGKSLEPSTLNLERVRWHLIGHLQRNKAKHAVELFDVIHSVDSLELIEELDRQATNLVQGSRFKVQGQEPPKPIEALIQVNVSGEDAKFGCKPEEAASLARAVLDVQGLKLVGFMTMAPFSHDPESARPHFRRLRQLRDDVAGTLNLQPSTLNLSMGMSQDFEVAIEEGADLVRIGTAIFGRKLS